MDDLGVPPYMETSTFAPHSAWLTARPLAKMFEAANRWTPQRNTGTSYVRTTWIWIRSASNSTSYIVNHDHTSQQDVFQQFRLFTKAKRAGWVAIQCTTLDVIQQIWSFWMTQTFLTQTAQLECRPSVIRNLLGSATCSSWRRNDASHIYWLVKKKANATACSWYHQILLVVWSATNSLQQTDRSSRQSPFLCCVLQCTARKKRKNWLHIQKEKQQSIHFVSSWPAPSVLLVHCKYRWIWQIANDKRSPGWVWKPAQLLRNCLKWHPKQWAETIWNNNNATIYVIWMADKITYYPQWTWPKWMVPYRLWRFVCVKIGYQ